jgi:hypothetical protein
MKKVSCYISVIVVSGSAGVGYIIDDETMTVENGKRVEPVGREELLKIAVEEFLRAYRGLKDVLNGRLEVMVSSGDFETVRKFLPAELRGYLSICNYNPAEQVAAEFAIGERR